jgi:hypothetical protein
MLEATLDDPVATPGVCVCTFGEASPTAGPPAVESPYALYQQQVLVRWHADAVRTLWVDLVYQTHAYASNDDPAKTRLLTEIRPELLWPRDHADLAREDQSVQAQPAAGYIGHAVVGSQGLPAVSLIGWDGQMQSVVIAATATPAGAIQDLGGVFSGYGMAANERGQVVLPATLTSNNGSVVEAVLLLTPSTP